MAKAKTAAAPKAKRKTVRAAVKAVTKAAPRANKKGVKKAAGNAADALWKLADNPLVGELLALGATAAVVALAEGGLSGKKKVSAKSVKTAGKAAAAAIGARLISEFTEVKKPAKAAKAKPARAAKAKAAKAPRAAKAKPARAKRAKA
jgi:hypothetical protein